LCRSNAEEELFCQVLERTKPALAARHCGRGAEAAANTTAKKPRVAAANVTGKKPPAVQAKANTTAKKQPAVAPVDAKLGAKVAAAAQPSPGATGAFAVAQVAAVAQPTPVATGAFAAAKARIIASSGFNRTAQQLARALGCSGVQKAGTCASYVREVSFCLAFADKMESFARMSGSADEAKYCKRIDTKLPQLSMLIPGRRNMVLAEVSARLERRATSPEDDLAKEMTHDLEMNFNKIAPFGKEDTAKELQDHAAKTQDTLVDAVENAEVAEIKRAVFRALTRLRAATIKEFDTIARLETQAIDAYNDAHHYRAENPLAHLHEDEAPVETDKLKSFH